MCLARCESAGQGKTLGKYGEAHYIAVSKRGEIFVADTLNWRVQKYVKNMLSYPDAAQHERSEVMRADPGPSLLF